VLNIDEFINRINELMEEYQLNASSLADKIGVQRSSLSHILSKRNKPSLDFILKIENNFKKIDLNWLLFGKSTLEDIKEYDEKIPNSTDLIIKTNPLDVKKTKIKEIIHLYEDGSFNVYFPKNKIE
tara:strand:+ start:1864 stop:2241 length:378 start_codon:yes stop_codon:yes gene_type:complete